MGHAAVVECLLDAGADLNAEDADHETPLHKAAARAHLRCAALLLEGGALAHLADRRSLTALHHLRTQAALHPGWTALVELAEQQTPPVAGGQCAEE
jgi:ankyrin repeat protein